MQDLRLYQLLHKELTDDISQEEIVELNSLKSLPNFEATKNEVAQVWNVSREYFPTKSFDVGAAKARFRDKISQNIPTKPIVTKPNVASTDTLSIRNLLGIAAALVLIATVSYLYFGPTDAKKAQTYEQVEYALLDDKTEVWLSEDASITVGDFTTENFRAVKLDGEAKFKVTSNPNKKFIIDVGNANFIEVIGTQFTAISDNGRNQSAVDVEEGNVRFYNANDKTLEVLLTRGESAIIDNSKKSIIKGSDPLVVKKKISFNNTPFPDVFSQLADSYNVTFEFDKDAVASCRFTSPLVKNYTLGEIIEVIVNVKKGDFPEFSIVKSIEFSNQFIVSGINCK